LHISEVPDDKEVFAKITAFSVVAHFSSSIALISYLVDGRNDSIHNFTFEWLEDNSLVLDLELGKPASR
jgi:hypothetical protein